MKIIAEGVVRKLKKKISLVLLVGIMAATTYLTFNALKGIDDIFEVDFSDEPDEE